MAHEPVRLAWLLLEAAHACRTVQQWTPEMGVYIINLSDPRIKESQKYYDLL